MGGGVMKSIAFTDQYGDRHIVYARTEEAIDAVMTLCEEYDLEYDLNPEDS
jgi:hypothetical protein